MEVVVEATGKNEDVARFYRLVSGRKMLTSKIFSDVGAITHWWLVRRPDESRAMYFGTPESFERWCDECG